MPSRNQAQRQPSTPPAQVAIAAHSDRADQPDAVRAHVASPPTSGRGCRSGSCRRSATGAPGCCSPWRCPVAKRVQNSMNALIASPDRNTKTPNAMLAQPTIGTRFTRSASHPIGTAPSTKNADDAVAMNTIVPAADPERLADLGREHVDRRALELVERAAGAASTTNMSLPPTLNASWNETGSECTPGRSSSGKMTCSRDALLGDLACVLLVEHGRGE